MEKNTYKTNLNVDQKKVGGERGRLMGIVSSLC